MPGPGAAKLRARPETQVTTACGFDCNCHISTEGKGGFASFEMAPRRLEASGRDYPEKHP